MAWKEKEIEKLYYTIGEVAQMLSVNTSLIRYWEKEFDLLKPKKSAKGDRLFTKTDIENIRIIHYLVRERGYTLDGAKAHIKTNLTLTKKNLNLKERLLRLKTFLEDLRDQIE